MKFLNYPYAEPITPEELMPGEWVRGEDGVDYPPPIGETEASEKWLWRIGRQMPPEVRDQLLLEQQTVIDNFAKYGETSAHGKRNLRFGHLNWETLAMDAASTAFENTKPIWEAIDGIVVPYQNQDFGNDPYENWNPYVLKLLGMEVANQQQFISDNFGPLVSPMKMHPNFEKLVSPYIRRRSLEREQTENRLSGRAELSAYNLNVDMIQHGHTLSGGSGGSYINLK